MPLTFGFEIEYFIKFSPNADLNWVVDNYNVLGNPFNVKFRRANYSDHDYNMWLLKSDSSIKGNNEHSTKIELVSPPLVFNQNTVELINNVINNIIMRFLEPMHNNSCGFHVHIGRNKMSIPQLKSICKNFIKYENVTDRIFPAARRDNVYCKSNKATLRRNKEDNQRFFDAINGCNSINDLRNKLNGGTGHGNRYYKLNLQPNNTIEFRQHQGTLNSYDIINWIHFLVLFCKNTIRSPPRNYFANSTSMDDRKERLIGIINNAEVNQWFSNRYT